MQANYVTYSKNGEGKGGLDLADASQIRNEDFAVLKNFRRDSAKRLITRRGLGKFGDNPDSKPCTSYIFHKRDDGGGKIALRFSGTKIYKYVEATDTWSQVYASASEFESDGVTRTRWGYLVYKNEILAGNGVDSNVRITIPGGVVTADASLPKCRYFCYLQDVCAGTGEDANPNTLYYSDALAASVANLDDNAIVIGGDEQGKTTGIKEAGKVFLVSKEKKIFSVDLANELVEALDAKNGMYSHRAWRAAGNGTLLFSDDGISTLTPRQGVEGGAALSSKPDSAKVNNMLRDIAPANYNHNCGFVLDNIEYDQYFFSFDTNGDSVPNKTLVRSNRTGDYSQYTTPPAYDYGIYEMDDGTIKYILCATVGGQMYEMETGFDDDGSSIEYDLRTKNSDFDQPEIWKDFEMFSIFGLKNRGSEITAEIYFDGELVASATIDDDNADVSAGGIPIGIRPIGGGGLSPGTDFEDVFPYRIHIPLLGYGGATKIQLRLYCFAKNTIFSLDKTAVKWNGNTFDILEYEKIA